MEIKNKIYRLIGYIEEALKKDEIVKEDLEEILGRLERIVENDPS
ncbi:MAG: hypothetical protein Q4Q13_05975 [Vagococcus sp.]|nr:hypothetical protein [Vagococcus sp.]